MKDIFQEWRAFKLLNEQEDATEVEATASAEPEETPTYVSDDDEREARGAGRRRRRGERADRRHARKLARRTARQARNREGEARDAEERAAMERAGYNYERPDGTTVSSLGPGERFVQGFGRSSEQGQVVDRNRAYRDAEYSRDYDESIPVLGHALPGLRQFADRTLGLGRTNTEIASDTIARSELTPAEEQFREENPLFFTATDQGGHAPLRANFPDRRSYRDAVSMVDSINRKTSDRSDAERALSTAEAGVTAAEEMPTPELGHDLTRRASLVNQMADFDRSQAQTAAMLGSPETVEDRLANVGGLPGDFRTSSTQGGPEVEIGDRGQVTVTRPPPQEVIQPRTIEGVEVPDDHLEQEYRQSVNTEATRAANAVPNPEGDGFVGNATRDNLRAGVSASHESEQEFRTWMRSEPELAALATAADLDAERQRNWGRGGSNMRAAWNSQITEVPQSLQDVGVTPGMTVGQAYELQARVNAPQYAENLASVQEQDRASLEQRTSTVDVPGVSGEAGQYRNGRLTTPDGVVYDIAGATDFPSMNDWLSDPQLGAENRAWLQRAASAGVDPRDAYEYARDLAQRETLNAYLDNPEQFQQHIVPSRRDRIQNLRDPQNWIQVPPGYPLQEQRATPYVQSLLDPIIKEEFEELFSRIIAERIKEGQ